jgi:predicted RNA-binding protein with PIN domain
MPLLIDGHNLIGKMSELSLEDPEDEVKLVHRLRRYCWRHRRRATVIFDAGLPGDRSPRLSTPETEIIFASAGGDADAIIRRRLATARDPSGILVVSSDQAVQAAARERGARIMEAEDFAERLAEHPLSQSVKEPLLSEEEVMDWLRFFEDRRERKRTTREG